jgi:hypothetical protein
MVLCHRLTPRQTLSLGIEAPAIWQLRPPLVANEIVRASHCELWPGRWFRRCWGFGMRSRLAVNRRCCYGRIMVWMGVFRSPSDEVPTQYDSRVRCRSLGMLPCPAGSSTDAQRLSRLH